MRKKYLWRVTLLLVVAIGAAIWAAPADAFTGSLDGKTFSGQIGKKGSTQGDRDNFIFKDGKFRSSGCDRYGFGDGAYIATSNGGITFVAQTESPREGTIRWVGIVKENTVEGTASWTKSSDKEPEEYWFKGKLKKR